MPSDSDQHVFCSLYVLTQCDRLPLACLLASDFTYDGWRNIQEGQIVILFREQTEAIVKQQQ